MSDGGQDTVVKKKIFNQITQRKAFVTVNLCKQTMACARVQIDMSSSVYNKGTTNLHMINHERGH